MDEDAAHDLQEAAEAYLVDLFKASQGLAEFRGADMLETVGKMKPCQMSTTKEVTC